MNQLITAAIAVSNIEPLVSFPRPLLNDFEVEVVDWVLSFYKKHGAIPTLPRLQTEYPHFMPIEEAGAPITDIYEQTLKRKRKEFAIGRVAEIELELKESDDLPLGAMDKMMRVLSASSSDVDRYSTFDRDRYFRTGSGLQTGFRLIDRATGNLHNGEFALIAGRLGSGKTTTTQWIVHQWWEQGKKILFVSNEMLSEDVFARFDGMLGKFNPLLLRSRTELERLAPTLKVVRHMAEGCAGEIIVPRTRLMSPASVVGMAQYLAIDVIVIDGVYLMHPDDKAASKWESVAAVSNALKQSALELQLPILGVTQIKRVGDKKSFDAEDLAYSDALGQDADFAFGIHPSKTEKGVADVEMFKNRFGPLMSTRIQLDFDSMTLTELSVVAGATEDWSK
jgi:replicative DNA helicase